MNSKVINSFSDISLKRNSVITIGKFDGLHIGHQKLLKHTIAVSKKNNMLSIAIVFSKGSNNLYPMEENIKVIKSFGINYIIVIDFSDKFYKMSPEEFFYKLIQYYNMKHIVVGSDFRFGANRLGDTSSLREYAEKVNNSENFVKNEKIKVDVLDFKKINGNKVSTTDIIKALSSGNIKLASKMLGRNYSIKGIVSKGKQLGRVLGYPTANLYVHNIINIPKAGVYFSIVWLGNKCYKSITFIGNSKVNDHSFRLEAYILNFNKDIYGKSMTVELLKYSRDNVKVETIDELITLLKRDEIQAYNYFKRRKQCL